MSHGGDIDRYVKDPSLLVELCREVIERLDAEEKAIISNVDSRAMETQLREIAKAADKLEKLGVPVPEALRAEKTKLSVALQIQEEHLQRMQTLYDHLNVLLRDIRNRLPKQSTINSDNNKLITERFAPDRLSIIVLRQTIITALHELGGRGSSQSLFSTIAELLKGQFKSADLVWLEHKKWQGFSWQQAVYSQRKNMVKDGVLRGDSPKGIWELSEDYR